jgi:hypothetical protein
MKTFKKFVAEASRIFPDVAPKNQFGDKTKMKLLSKGIVPPQENPNKPVDTTGANSPFADPKVKSYRVSPDKPMVGSDDAVGKLLASKGYSRTGEKPNVSSKRNFPDKPPAPQTMQDRLNMMRMDSDVSHKRFRQKMDAPFQKSIPSTVSKLEPKVGSRVAPQSGYPASKKTRLAPAENQKASSGGSYKIKPGDNPTKIAKSLGTTPDDLEKKNPGFLKRARRLKPGETINR